MERTAKYSLEETCEALKKLPPRRLSKHLEAFLERTIAYKNNVARLCKEVYHNAENPEAITETLTKLANAGEYDCFLRRLTLDAMYQAAHCNNNCQTFHLPTQTDLSSDIQVSYQKETNTLHLVMPQLLPLKTKWNAYLPGKIRYALAAFDRAYQAQNATRLRISPAYLLFVHHYNNDSCTKGIYRDYDNMEYSCVLNALHSTHIFNDSASTHICTQMAVRDSKSFTEVYVTEVSGMAEVMQNVDLSLYYPKGDGP